jgi:DNA-binding GntR family transcriptional regulator
MPEVHRPDPPYVQIANQIREQIKSGELKDGDLIPSARQIKDSWDVAIGTAQRVLALLGSQGLVRPIKGVGTVVHTAGVLHLSARDRLISIGKTGKIYPPGHYAKIRSVGLASVPERVAGALGIEEGEEAIRRRRTTYTSDDIPVATSVSWYPAHLAGVAPLLLETSRIIQGTSRYIEEQSGRIVAATYVQHSAGSATENDAAELGIPAGAPVLLTRNRFFDSDGLVLEYGESAAQPGHWVFYEYTTEDGQ